MNPIFRNSLSLKHWGRRLKSACRLLLAGQIQDLLRRSLALLKKTFSRKKKIDYKSWREKWVLLNEKEKKQLVKLISLMEQKPYFEIFIDPKNCKISHLKTSLNSLLDQHFDQWSVHLIANHNCEKELRSLVKELDDQRIQFFEKMPTKPDSWFLQIQPGDLLHEVALFALADAANNNRKALVIYTDNDHLSPSGSSIDPFMKPDWNPDLLAGTNYFSSLTTFKSYLWEKHFYDSADPHELAIKATKDLLPDQILHIPFVLTSIRVPDSNSHLTPPTVRVNYQLPDPLPKVSVLIPTKNQGKLLKRCIASLCTITDYPDFEIVIVDHETTEKKARVFIDSLKSEKNVLVTEFCGEFNFSAQINQAAEKATGEIFVLLNNDTEIIEANWLTELIMQVARPEVGVAGALLLFGNETIQHAGIHPGIGGLMSHGHKHLGKNSSGYFSRLKVAHEVMAVTGACLAIKSSTWKQLGGLDAQNLPVAYNDVDLCMRSRKMGLRVIFTPHAKVVHHESVSRGFDDNAKKTKRLMKEAAVISERWGELLYYDPAYSPNLSFEGDGFQLADTPRTKSVLGNANKDYGI